MADVAILTPRSPSNPAVIPSHLWDVPDLTFGAYPQHPAVSGRDVELDDILDHLVTHGLNGPQWIELRYTGPEQDAPAPYELLLTSRVPAKNPDAVLRPDVADVRFGPQNIVNAANDLWGMEIPRYPGYALRRPKKPSPVGEPWPEHPWYRPGFEMHHPSQFDNNDEYGLYTRDHLGQLIERAVEFEDLRGGRVMRFRKWLTVHGPAWQDVSLHGS